MTVDIPDPKNLGRKDDDIDEALAAIQSRDPSLWRILNNYRKKLSWHSTEVRVWFALLALMNGSTNPWVQRIVHLLPEAPAAIVRSQPAMNHVVIETAPDMGTLKLFTLDGTQRMSLQCRNDAVGGDGYGHDARCPLGEYQLGTPEPNTTDEDKTSMGLWFIPVIDVNGLWAPEGRSGIGIHGGGSASPDPLAPDQGFYPTLGCFRVLNGSLGALAYVVRDGDRLTVTRIG